MAFTPPPVAPQRGDRTTFSDRVDAFLMWMVNLVAEMNVFLLSLTRLAAGGANSFAFGFDTTITDSDPGPGRIRLNNATQNAATVVRIDNISGDGADLSASIAAILAGTSTIKAALRIQKVRDPAAFLLFDVTGGSGTDYKNLGVTIRASSGANPFALNDDVIVYLERVGDKGDTGVPPVIPYMKASDRKTPGTAAQSLTSNSTVTRALNTVEFSGIPGASLATNQVLLPPGTYDFKAVSGASGANSHRIQLRNITSAAVVAVGLNSDSRTGGIVTTSTCTGRFTISSTSSFSVEHYSTAGGAGGVAISSGMENYAELEFWKVG